MDQIDKIIINRLQGGFPICERPFAEVSAKLGIDENMLIERINHMINEGVLSRFGPMYNVEKMGGIYSLVAMKVPVNDLNYVVEIINSYPEIAHNYEREHEFNLWFVLAVESQTRKQEVLAEIESRTGYTVYDMPKREEFYVGLKLDV